MALALSFSGAPAQAQANPDETDCGLPAGGVIVTAVTYTMTADCVLTSPLVVENSIQVDINGGGFTITRAEDTFTAWSGSDSFIYAPTDGPEVGLAQVTLDAEGRKGDSDQLVSIGLNVHTLTTNFVSFLNAPDGWGSVPNGGVWNLANTLFRGNRVGLQSLSAESTGSALNLNSGSVTSLNGVVFEKNLNGGAALKVNSGASVSVLGCVSDIANIPRFLQGSFTGSGSLTPCTGNTAGNGHTIETRTATPRPCGYPAGGEVRGTTTFTLRSNCATTDHLYVTEGVTLTIEGGGHAITGDPPQVTIFIGHNSRVNLNDVALHGVRFFNFGHIEGELVAFYPPLTNRAIVTIGTVNINKLLMERLDFTNLGAFGMALYTQSPPATNPSPGDVTIEDAIFKDITNGASAATLFSWYSGATITLNGCITDENNVPALIVASPGGGSTIHDNRDGPCPDDFIDEFPGKRRLTPPTTDDPSGDGAGATGRGPSESWIPPTPTPIVSTCLTLEGLWVDGITHSTQCQRIPGYAIGNDDIAMAPYVDAIDVWGWVLPDTTICLFAAGSSFKFIDTTPLPRVVYDLPATSQNGMTCATIDRAGILVLLPGEAPPASASAAAAAGTQALSNCMVRTLNMLNFRDAPAGESIGAVPYDATLTALEKSSGWFKVDYHGEQGWISAEHVEPKGNCG